MKRTQRARFVSIATGLMVIVGMLSSAATSAAQSPLIFPLNKGRQPGKTVTTSPHRTIAPIGNLRVVKPMGGTRPPAKTILAKRPS